MTVLFLAVFMICFICVIRLVERKDSMQKNGSFYEVADEIDVLFLGTSHVINGVNPVQMYEDYGIASYNLGGHGNVLPVTYWELVNALDYCTPKCVIVDTFQLEKDYHYVDQMTEADTQGARDNAVGQLHEVLDSFPMSRNKLAAINDLISDPEIRKEFLFDFIRYHSRWSELEADDYTNAFRTEATSLMGAQMRMNADQRLDSFPLIKPSEMMEQETNGKLYLRRILDLCRRKGIQAILVHIPYAADPDYQRAANSAQVIADEYEVPYLNLMYAEDLIDLYSDLSSQTHLNVHGAYRVTDYLGKMLRNDLEMPDRRGEESTKAWQDLCATWHNMLRDGARDAEDLYSELMFLQFDEVSSIVYINNNSQAFNDTAVIHLVKALAGGSQGMDSAAVYRSPYCVIHDNKGGNYVETMGESPIEGYATSFGTVNYHNYSGIYSMLTVGEDTQTNLLNYDLYDEIDVQVFLFDNKTGKYMGSQLYENSGMQRQW